MTTQEVRLRVERLRGKDSKYHMAWLNETNDTFNIDSTYCSGGPFKRETASPGVPGTPLSPGSHEQLGWFNNTFGGEPITNGSIVFKTPHGRVGVNIHVPPRVFAVGPPPYYEVFHDETGSAGLNWTNPVTEPSMRYTFPTSVGYKITIDPIASDLTLFMIISVEPLA